MSAPAVIFIGPSSPPGVAWPPEIERLPPAALGDLYRVAGRAEPPKVIGLADGYFEARPPVRHAEILWALSRGIRVLGASSIGALRAAELAEHGMESVGAIAAGYRSGTLCGEPLEADDEVAVTHGPAELGYPPLSVALIDLRASLAAAADAGVLSVEERQAALTAVRHLHFKDRSHDAAAAALSDAKAMQLLSWLRQHAVSLKRQDAALLIERVGETLRQPSPPTAAPAFQVTDSWIDFVAWAGSADSDGELLVALALDPPLRARVLRQALLRLLADREAVRRGREGDSVAAMTELFGPSLTRRLGAAAEDLGLRAALEEAVRRRRAGRRALDAGAPSASAAGLLRSHFQRLGMAVPQDLEAYARSLGLSRGEQLLRALAEDAAAQGQS